VTRFIALAASAWFLTCVGCSSVRDPGFEKSEVTAANGHRILVMLKESPLRHYRPGSGLFGEYGSTPAAARDMELARQLAQTYGFVLITDWPMPSLGVRCFLGEIRPDADPDNVVAHIAADARVESAQPVRQFHTMGRHDPLGGLQPSDESLRLDELHRMATGKKVRVAQIDTGVDVGHPGFKGRAVEAVNFVGRSDYAAESHGTAVAGIIVAKAPAQMDTVGVAPDATLFALRACWQTSAESGSAVCDSFTLAKAIQYAILRHAHVLNLSLVGPPDRILERLIDRALENGVVVIGAIDPGSPSNSFPARHLGVVAVAAANVQSSVPVAIYAPGDHVLTTIPGGGWEFVSGSSFAAAHVSAIIALLLETDPKLTPGDIHSMLHEQMASDAGVSGVPVLNDCILLAKVWRKPNCPCCKVVTDRPIGHDVGKRSS
jgi:subtilisin family serine protease